MTEKSMNAAIHAAFRRDLARFVRALESFPTGDATRANELSRAWTQLEDQLTHHHTGEHEIAWPALAGIGVRQELLDSMDSEHAVMATALAQVRTTIEELRQEPDQERAAAALTAMRELQAVTVQHLDHEEAELEPVYQANKDTPQMKAMGRAFGKVSPARGGRFFAWLTDGASADDVAAIRANVPGPVLMIVGGLFGRGYRKDIAPVWTR